MHKIKVLKRSIILPTLKPIQSQGVDYWTNFLYFKITNQILHSYAVTTIKYEYDS